MKRHEKVFALKMAVRQLIKQGDTSQDWRQLLRDLRRIDRHSEDARCVLADEVDGLDMPLAAPDGKWLEWLKTVVEWLTDPETIERIMRFVEMILEIIDSFTTKEET